MNESSEMLVLAYRGLPDSAKREVLNRLLLEPGSPEFLETETLLQANARKLSELSGKPSVLPSYPKPKSRTWSRITYDDRARLSGQVQGHTVSVSQSPTRRFRTVIDGTEYPRLPMAYVEDEFGVKVIRKRNGANGETVSRALYRHLANRYNNGDATVIYEPLN